MITVQDLKELFEGNRRPDIIHNLFDGYCFDPPMEFVDAITVVKNTIIIIIARSNSKKEKYYLVPLSTRDLIRILRGKTTLYKIARDNTIAMLQKESQDTFQVLDVEEGELSHSNLPGSLFRYNYSRHWVLSILNGIEDAKRN